MTALAFGLLTCLSFQSCFEPKKGCTDINATNWDAAADEDCCCEYPKLVFNVEQNFGDSVFIPGKHFEIEPGKWFKIQSIVFYLSDFQLVKSGQAFWSSPDSLLTETFPDSTEKTFHNDFQLVRRTQGEYEIGEFREVGTFEKAGFSFGLSEPANEIIPSLAPSGHVLRSQPEGLWSETERFSFAKIIFSRDTVSATTPDTLALTRANLSKTPFLFDGVFTHDPGKNFEITLTVDFKKWFSMVNLSTDDNQSIKAKIVANLQGSFIVSP